MFTKNSGAINMMLICVYSTCYVMAARSGCREGDQSWGCVHQPPTGDGGRLCTDPWRAHPTKQCHTR